ncbi:hemerythrin domain-containing protein [Arenibacter sp. F20364]|uniref:hemerythrin domain-containing protein n=1 Tax=Arenibacter sp. F20364 TaxID=2926415 RepID=UPI001FF34E65|nr:hemerythrin domain-containing protein [Arenibacter sp. F20364]MCK0189821.1 hemerythrin domain-containing protein [Arenibacter sp. F20364]
MKVKPIKRHKAIQPLSRDHHQGLLLSWKIRTGFSKGVSTDRIKTYVDWFYKTHLMSHFKEEEEYLFPILGNDNELVKKAISQHKRLNRLFRSTTELEKSLNRIEEELEKHIRFEERVLFNEIQKVATEQQLLSILEHHADTKFLDNTTDKFWE